MTNTIGGDTMIHSVRACARRHRLRTDRTERTDRPESDRPARERGELEPAGRTLGAHLQGADGNASTVLHGRSLPGTECVIEHLVVAASGVWIIDTSSQAGRVRRRNIGGLMRHELRLMVGDDDHTSRAVAMGDQTDAIERLMGPLGIATLPLHRVLCFTDADWPRFARPFDVAGVLVCWPSKLASMIGDGGPFDHDTIDRVVAHLDRELPIGALPSA
jgi:hypothetical protein